MSLRSDTLRITKVSKVSVSKVSFVILRHYFASEVGHVIEERELC